MYNCPICQAPLAPAAPSCAGCGQQIQWVQAPPPPAPPSFAPPVAPPPAVTRAAEPPPIAERVTAPGRRVEARQAALDLGAEANAPERAPPPAREIAPPVRREAERLPPPKSVTPPSVVVRPPEPERAPPPFEDVRPPTREVRAPPALDRRPPAGRRLARPEPTEESTEIVTALRQASPAADPLPGELEVRRVAPLWRRLAAWTADFVLLGAVLTAFLSLASGLVHHGPPSRQSGLDWIAETALAYGKLWIPALALFSIITVGYLALFTALGGQTPGKRLLRLEVVDSEGQLPGLVRSVVRAILALGSGLLVLMGFLLALFDRRHQALHDKLAGTYVVCRS